MATLFSRSSSRREAMPTQELILVETILKARMMAETSPLPTERKTDGEWTTLCRSLLSRVEA